MPSFSAPSALLLILLLLSTPALGRFEKFQSFQAEYDAIYNRVIRSECASEYQFWKNGQTNGTYYHTFTRWLGASDQAPEQLTVPLIDCMMNASSKFMKSNMASANVLLGLTPTILALLGSSIDETSVLAIVGKRPLLSLALAAGSPAVIPLPLLNYVNPLLILKSRKDDGEDDDDSNVLPDQFFLYNFERLLSVIEYIFLLAAIINVVELSVELGYDTSLAFAPGNSFLTVAWSFFGIIGHLCGWMSMVWLTRRENRTQKQGHFLRRGIQWMRDAFDLYPHMASLHDSTGKGVAQRCLNWMLIGYSRKSLPPKFKYMRQSRWTLFWNSTLSVMTCIHVILGTLIFSSMLFISARDAVYVLGRFMASAVVCRVILKYELDKLRMLYNMDKPTALSTNDVTDYELVTLNR